MTDGARVIAMSSLGAQRAMPGYGFIGASKAALESLARALAQELGPRGIRVNVVSAGVVDTDALAYFPNREELLANFAQRTPAGPVLTPQDVAGRRLPALPAGSRDDQRPHAGRRRRLRDLGLTRMNDAHRRGTRGQDPPSSPAAAAASDARSRCSWPTKAPT